MSEKAYQYLTLYNSSSGKEEDKPKKHTPDQQALSDLVKETGKKGISNDNENLLFSDKSAAEDYVSLHDELSAQGKDVENYEKINVYELWKHKD